MESKHTANGQRVGYKRVSSIDQNLARQLEGIELDRVFPDKLSGKNADRPKLQEMLEYIREGDTVFVHSLDRLARNLVDLHDIVKTITNKKASVTFVTENLTFTGDDAPLSVLLLQVLGAFAQFQRMLIREAQREGIAIAKREGVYKGRKKKLSMEVVTIILQRISEGESKAQIARDLGVSRKTLYQHLNAAAKVGL
ncbi:MAG TPA: recombinase family protein [Ktedonobacteraceae bacterium]|nr:recombinase family protein [Ktedonobacteraceae bacterium]